MPRTTTPKAPATDHPVLGRLPAGWKAVRLGDLFDFRNGYNTSKEHYGSGTPFVNVLEVITHPSLRVEQIIGKVNIPARALEHNDVRYGDVLFNRTSEVPEEVGLACVYLSNDVVCFGGFVIRARPKTDRLDPDYLTYALRATVIRKQIVALGTGAIRSNIGQSDLVDVVMAVPPLPEQRRIARILGTWDKAIGLLGLQIAAKEERLRGLIDQLVSGKRHGAKGDKLPKGWRWVSLGEVFEFLSTTSHSRSQLIDDPEKGDVLYIHYGDIHATYTTPRLDLDIEERVPRLLRGTTIPRSADYLKDGDLIIADASEDIEGVGACVELHNVDGKQVISGLHTLALRDTKGLTVQGYRGYVLRSHQVVKRIREVATGSKVYGLSRTNLAKLKVPLPSPEEQRIIGSCLNGAYDELDILRTKLEHLHEQKRGLMQRLLAGANS